MRDLRAVVRRSEGVYVVAAERFAAWHSEERLGLAIPLEDGAVHAHSDDRAASRVHQRAEQRLAALERLGLLEQLLVLELLCLRLRGTLLLELTLVAHVAKDREAGPGRLLGTATDRPCAHRDPSHLATLTYHTENATRDGLAGPKRHRSRQLLGRTGDAVFGDDVTPQLLDPRNGSHRADAEDAERARVRGDHPSVAREEEHPFVHRVENGARAGLVIRESGDRFFETCLGRPQCAPDAQPDRRE